MSEIQDMQSEHIEKLKKEIKLMDHALMQIAALPTVGGALAREWIENIRKEIK